MNSEDLEALDKIIEESDNAFEAFFAALIYYIVKIIMRAAEVVIELGTDTQSTNQES